MIFRPNTQERNCTLPGDDLVADAIIGITHAITIIAPPDKVWPWLVQMGAGRAGWYSYDRLDNGGVPSACEIIEKLQSISVGDIMPALPGATDAFVISELKPPNVLVLSVPLVESSEISNDRGKKDHTVYRASWVFVLNPFGEEKTRFIVRVRLGKLLLRMPFIGLATIPKQVAMLIARPIHFIMAQKQLRSIKRRAEYLAKRYIPT